MRWIQLSGSAALMAVIALGGACDDTNDLLGSGGSGGFGAAGGTGGSGGAGGSGGQTGGSGGGTGTGGTGGSKDAGADTGTPDASASLQLSNSQIAGVLDTVNKGEIAEAQLAATQATRPEVKQYAQMMIEDHTALSQQASQLFQQLGIGTQQSPISQQLVQLDQQDLTVLRQRGIDFDNAYIDIQVAGHIHVLDIIDYVLLPSVGVAPPGSGGPGSGTGTGTGTGSGNGTSQVTAQMRTLLMRVRSVVSVHLAEAKELQTMLASGDAGADAGAEAGDGGGDADAGDGAADAAGADADGGEAGDAEGGTGGMGPGPGAGGMPGMGGFIPIY